MDITQVDRAYQSHSQELFGRLISLTRDSQAAPQLHELMSDLNQADRLTVLMAAEGYSRPEIARAASCSEYAVRARLCRARARLRERLRDLRPDESLLEETAAS